MNHRGFTHLVALVTITVIAIAMIGVMAWFRMEVNELPQGTVDTIGTRENKVYEDKKYGFAFEYPSNLVAFEQDSGGGIVLPLGELNESIDTPGDLILSEVNNVKISLSPRTLENEINLLPYNYGEEMAIGGQPGYLDTAIRSEEGVHSRKALVSYDDRTIIIEAKGRQLDILPTILSTFYFTGENQGSDWKTFVSTKHGYQVMIPPDWQVIEGYKESLVTRIFQPVKGSDVSAREINLMFSTSQNDAELDGRVNFMINGLQAYQGKLIEFRMDTFILTSLGTFNFWWDLQEDSWVHHEILNSFEISVPS